MKKVLLIITVFILIVIGAFLLFNDETDEKVVKQKQSTLSEQIKLEDGQIIDVREPDEYIAGHADKAINVPLGDILKGDFSKIDSNKPIYVYCRSGNRSGQAKIALEKAGYDKITNIGGLDDWQNQNGKICAKTAPSC